MIFILSLLFSSGDSGHAMVTEDYYEKELYFQDEINSEKNANALAEKPEINIQANGFVLTFPEVLKDSKGEVYLMRNNNELQDVRLPLKIDSKGRMLISSAKLVEGEYELFLKFKNQDQDYLIKKSIKWISQ